MKMKYLVLYYFWCKQEIIEDAKSIFDVLRLRYNLRMMYTFPFYSYNQTTKSLCGSLREGGRDKDGEKRVYFREPIQIHARAIYHNSHSSFIEVVCSSL